LRYAKQFVAAAGVSEVTDITDSGNFGVHVFVSVRPQALGDPYTFGKGLNRVDAEVGAYMEALECYFAEPGHGRPLTQWGTARDIAGYGQSNETVLDFVPMLHSEVDLDAPLLLASVENMESADECLLPAELIHYPAPYVGQSLFGASTNGLASGNSVLEASIHALLELIERDIWSFEFVRPTSKLVEKSSLPDDVREIVERTSRNGLQLKVHTIPNDYGVPFFVAFLYDEKNLRRKTFNGGWGCDLNRRTALVRAVTEAVQSRLAFIHGGRKLSPWGATQLPCNALQSEVDLVRRHIRGVSDTHGQTSLAEIPDLVVGGSLSEQFEAVVERLRSVLRQPIYRAVYTPPELPLQVVRVVVPMLEHFQESSIRVGPRLKAASESHAGRAGCMSRL
jgi:ribosomal protein S12 methylthiotransferase accessory factor